MSAHVRVPEQAGVPAVPDTDAVVAVVEAVRLRAPLVQCITNSVVTGFTANVLLAAGAAPAMVDITGEAGPFAAVASALLVNLGTPTPEQRAAAVEAVTAATDAGTPWVLDPVAVGALPIRTSLAKDLAARRPTVVRGNASEIIALAGDGAGGRGVDSTSTAGEALPAARSLVTAGVGAVAVSGERDVVTDGSRVATLTGGDPLLTRVTGTGCALGALVAACAAVTDDALLAALTASAWIGAAAEIAVPAAHGPGSFAVGLIDALATLDGTALADRVRIS
ncbi:MAG: hydroxyethylthiazole kinase [Actinomycetota bacterium]|nr:hydroxyethylthiazole kinase [Actinomycetota bacterium]